MAARHTSPHSTGPGDALVRTGAVLFAVGLVAVVVAVVGNLVSGTPAPGALVTLAEVALPVGLGLALVGLVRGARTARRAARRSANPS